jgi:hypothetical protein
LFKKITMIIILEHLVFSHQTVLGAESAKLGARQEEDSTLSVKGSIHEGCVGAEAKITPWCTTISKAPRCTRPRHPFLQLLNEKQMGHRLAWPCPTLVTTLVTVLPHIHAGLAELDQVIARGGGRRSDPQGTGSRHQVSGAEIAQ